KHARAVTEAQEKLSQEMREADAKYPKLLQEIEQRRDTELNQADEKYPRLLDEIRQRFENDTRTLEESHRQQTETTKRLYAEAWNTITTRWRDGLASVDRQAHQLGELVDRASLNWNAGLDGWKVPDSLPPALRFGEFVIDMKEIPSGIALDERHANAGP